MGSTSSSKRSSSSLDPNYSGNEQDVAAMPSTSCTVNSRWTSCCDATPGARSGHALCSGQDGLLWIFGGCGRGDPTGDIVLDDLHEFNLDTLQWKKIERRGVPGERWPESRRSAAMATFDDQLYLSGGAGENPDELRSNLLEFDLRTRVWKELLAGESGLPFKLCGQTVCIDEERSRLLYFGGSTGLEYTDTTVEFLPATNEAREIMTAGCAPSPRYKHQAFLWDGHMYVIGGGSFRPRCSELDVYRLNLESHTWESFATIGQVPQARVAHSSMVDREEGKVYVFGGFTAALRCCSSTLHCLDLRDRSWADVGVDEVEPVPEVRSFHSSTFYRGACYVFGGASDAQKFSDVWSYVIRDTPPTLVVLAAKAILNLRYSHYRGLEALAALPAASLLGGGNVMPPSFGGRGKPSSGGSTPAMVDNVRRGGGSKRVLDAVEAKARSRGKAARKKMGDLTQVEEGWTGPSPPQTVHRAGGLRSRCRLFLASCPVGTATAPSTTTPEPKNALDVLPAELVERMHAMNPLAHTL